MHVVLIPLGERRVEPHPDVTGYPLIGWDPDVSPETLWERNRGHWPLTLDRAGACDYVAFQAEAKIVQVNKIDGVVASPFTDKIVFEGKPLPEDDPVARLLLGKSSHNRNPEYLDDDKHDKLARIILGEG